jgi:hypothetical protein
VQWQQALQLAASNEGYDYSDWRLPNVNELESLTDRACYDPMINSEIFPNTAHGSERGYGQYWTSTPRWNVSNHAVTVHFDEAGNNSDQKDRLYRIRLVRDAN